ncbi:TIR domain-containing protein [Streptococcus infantarius]|uniref:TIR domain-containing protein n=1 Tax=Streptococcus infantarius TaxID=102684 RepID=UPI003D09ADF3
MARKTFISYKYSEARNLRDDIICAMGPDATYYNGERSSSPNMSDRTTEYIKNTLKDMIYSTSVTIVIISPNMKQSNWIDWEIEYSLKQIKRGDRASGSNGIVGVVMKYNGDYSWLRPTTVNTDGCTSISTNDSYLYDIISKNRFNQNPKIYSCDKCQTVNSLNGSYISLVNEDDFLSNPSHYIENAYDKSKNVDGYDVSKIV